MKVVDILLLAGVAVIIASMFWLAYLIMFTEGPQCLNQPIEYFKEKTNNTCFCFSTFEQAARAEGLVRLK